MKKNIKIGLIVAFVITFLSVFQSNVNAITEAIPGTPDLRSDLSFIVNDTALVKYEAVSANNYVTTLNDNWSRDANQDVDYTGIFPATHTFTDNETGEHSITGWIGAISEGLTGREIISQSGHNNTIRVWDNNGGASIALENSFPEQSIMNISFWVYDDNVVTTGRHLIQIESSSGSIAIFLMILETGGINRVREIHSGTWNIFTNFVYTENVWHYVSIECNVATDTYNLDIDTTRLGTNIPFWNAQTNIAHFNFGTSDTNIGNMQAYYDAIDYSFTEGFYYKRNYNQIVQSEYVETDYLKIGENSYFPDTGSVNAYKRYSVGQFLIRKPTEVNQTLEYFVELWNFGTVLVVAEISIESIFFTLRIVNSTSTYYYHKYFVLSASNTIQIDITVGRTKLVDTEAMYHRCHIKIIEDYTKISILEQFAPFWKVTWDNLDAHIKHLDVHYSQFPDSNNLINNTLMKFRILVDYDPENMGLYLGIVVLGYIEGAIPDWIPTIPQPPNPNNPEDNRPYWDLYQWNLTFDSMETVFIGDATFNFTYDYAHSQIVQIIVKYHYDDFVGHSSDWGDWTWAFNWLRDGLHTILSGIWIGIQYIGCLLANFVTYVLGWLGCAIVWILWDILVFWLFFALCQVAWALVTVLMYSPLILSALLYIMAIVIAGIIWGLSFGSLDFNTVLNQINSVLQYVGNYIVELVDVFISNIDAFALFAIYYLILIGFIYFKVIYTKARGYTNRSAKLADSLEAYLAPIRFTIGLVSKIKDLVSPFS